MTRLPFIATHDGVSIRCEATLNAKAEVVNLAALLLASDTLISADIIGVVGKIQERTQALNDLIHAGVPFEALATCRNSPGINGAIIEGVCVALDGVCASLASRGARHE